MSKLSLGLNPKNNVDATNADLVKSFKGVDRMLGKVVGRDEIVPVTGSEQTAHPGAYLHRQEVPLSEKNRLVTTFTAIEPELTSTITDKDVEIMKDKAYMATLYDFDEWVAKRVANLDLSTPEKYAWVRDIYPEWFQRKINAINDLQDAKAKYEKLCIDGPSTIQDLFYMYRFDQFQKDIPFAAEKLKNRDAMAFMSLSTGPPAGEGGEQVQARADFATYKKLAFQRGVMNPRKRILDYVFSLADQNNGQLRTNLVADTHNVHPAVLIPNLYDPARHATDSATKRDAHTPWFGNLQL